MSSLEKLLEIMAQLRDPQKGCPWDQQQSFASIAPYTIEEAYEVADAIARDDMADLRDELGDLLFQVVFHAQMAEEQGTFGFADVAQGICDKMLRRHPHVFGTEEEIARGPAKGSWNRIKATERATRNRDSSAIDGVALALPALKRAEKLGKRAASVGFDWADADGAREKIDEELGEVQDACDSGNAAHIAEELGDLLFAVVNLARHLRVDPEQALVRANDKFERRFRCMEQAVVASGRSLTDMDIEALEAEWQSAKSKCKE